MREERSGGCSQGSKRAVVLGGWSAPCWQGPTAWHRHAPRIGTGTFLFPAVFGPVWRCKAWPLGLQPSRLTLFLSLSLLEGIKCVSSSHLLPWRVTATAISTFSEDENNRPLGDCDRKQFFFLSLFGPLVILFLFCPSWQFLEQCPEPTCT